MTNSSSSFSAVIQTNLPTWLQAAHTPGAAVALLERGCAPRFVCAGVQDLERQRPVTTDTVFEAASLGKPLFACLVMQSVREGKLELDAALSECYPEPWIADAECLPLITPRRVLSHSTGLPNWFRADRPRELLFAPGQRFGYSGEGFLYLQRVVEKLLGLPLEALARQRLFDPLGMARSGYVCPAALAAETAQGHDAQGCPLPKWNPAANAGTSLHTTASEYALFIQEMLTGGGRLLAGCADDMLQWQTPIDDSTAWGLGWGLKEIGGERIFWQWGDNTGWKHIAAGSAAQGRGVLVLTNGEAGSQVWQQVLRATLDPHDEIINWLDRLG